MPAARTPEIAARRFIEALASVTSCVTTQRLTTLTTYYVPGENQTIRFPDAPVSLRAASGGPRGLLFGVSHLFTLEEDPVHPRIRRRWRTTTRMYQYRLVDREERELLVYHWQPGDLFSVPIIRTSMCQPLSLLESTLPIPKPSISTGGIWQPAGFRSKHSSVC